MCGGILGEQVLSKIQTNDKFRTYINILKIYNI